MVCSVQMNTISNFFIFFENLSNYLCISLLLVSFATLLDIFVLGIASLFLLLKFLLSSFLDFSHGLFLGSILHLGIFISLSLDVFQGDTDDSLLDSDGSLSLLLGQLFSLDLLVVSSPGGGPSDSLSLNLLQEELSGLLGDEDASLS